MREALISLLMTFDEFIILDLYGKIYFCLCEIFWAKILKAVFFLRIGMCINKKISKNVIKWVG